MPPTATFRKSGPPEQRSGTRPRSQASARDHSVRLLDGDPAPAGASVAGYPQIAVGAEGHALCVRFEPDQGETVPAVDQRDLPAMPGELVQVRPEVPGEPFADDCSHALRWLWRRRVAGTPAAALVDGLVGQLGLRRRAE